MIDFIRIFYQDKMALEHFVCKQGNFEEVDAVYELHSRKIKYPYKARFCGIEVGITEKHGYVKNSIHKAYNEIATGESQNYSDFTYSNLCETIDFVSRKVVDVDIVRISQLEFGLNISTSVSAKDIISENVFMHKLKSHTHNRQFSGQGELKQFDHSNFCVKIYDKAMQYGLGYNLLRFEVRFKKSKELQQLGVYNLPDLKDKQVLRRLFLYLLKRFDEMIIVDSYSEKDISAKDYILLCEYNNPMYWTRLFLGKKYQVKMMHEKKYMGLLEKYDLLKTKKQLRELLFKKFIYLMNH